MEIVPVRAVVNDWFELFGDLTTPEKELTKRLGNPYNQGWNFPNGDPEFWKYSKYLLVPQGRLLDIGMGHGRTSLYFALNGMNITGYETDHYSLSAVHSLIDAYNLPIDIIECDILNAHFDIEQFDTTILGQTFVHFPSKQTALDTIKEAIGATKRGGHIWFRAGGKYDQSWDELAEGANYYHEISKVDEDVYIAPCTCSGEYRLDPQLFFDPMEIALFFTQQKLKLIHSQVIPTYGHTNIMYGEDWQPHNKLASDYRRGMITLLLEK